MSLHEDAEPACFMQDEKITMNEVQFCCGLRRQEEETKPKLRPLAVIISS